MSEPRRSRRGEGYGACDDERREARGSVLRASPSVLSTPYQTSF